MIIKNKNLGDLFLGPMAGVTDVGFRKVCKIAGADLTCTEMVSSKALIYNNKKTTELLYTQPEETLKQVQIFGHVPEEMASVCRMPELEKFDIIDINFGCPATKIIKNGDGSALLKNLPLMAKIVAECRKSTQKILSCKFRIGTSDNENIATEVAKLLEENGADFITLHGRTVKQGYAGEIDYDTIAKVKQTVHIPVVGNGNVFDKNSFNTLKRTGVDAVMIARGSLGDPNIFARLKGKKELPLFSLICQHIDTLRKYYSDNILNLYMRKHLLWYLKDIPNVQPIKLKISQMDNIDEMLNLIKPLFS